MLSLLALWRYLRARRDELSSSAFRRMCLAEHLHHLRVREWFDLDSQLRQVCTEAGLGRSSMLRPADEPGRGAAAADFAVLEADVADRVHRSVLAGLLSHIGLREGDAKDYLGARGTRFSLAPGTSLVRGRSDRKGGGGPGWVMAVELVETARLFARNAAVIEPDWVEPLAAHLVQRSYSEPRWNAKRGQVEATERVTLYGIPLVAARTVGFGRIDAALSRELFLQHALVERDWASRHEFLTANARLLADVAEIEERTRRRDVVVPDSAVFSFYDSRVPADVVSARHFDAWWKQARRETPDLLTMTRADVLTGASAEVGEDAFPERLQVGAASFELGYRFSPGTVDDGLTVVVPVEALAGLDTDALGWLVPGLREELVTALIRSLPKALRRSFAPAADHAADVLRRVQPVGRVTDVVARALTDLGGPVVAAGDFELDRMPAHLRPRVRVVDAAGTSLGEGDDVAELRRRLAQRLQNALAEATSTIERTGLTSFDVDPLPRTVERELGGHQVRGWPALVDQGSSVAVRVLGAHGEADAAHVAGLRRLLLLGIPSPVQQVVKALDTTTRLSLAWTPYPTVLDMLEDCLAAAVDSLMRAHAPQGGPVAVRDAATFASLRDAVRGEVHDVTAEIVRTVGRVLAALHEVRARLDDLDSPALREVVADVREQLDWLGRQGFVLLTGRDRLPHVVRYLAAVRKRLDTAPNDLDRDLERMDQVHGVLDAWYEAVDALPSGAAITPELVSVRWMVEELRVSLFAQTLGTAHPVSEKRVRAALAAAEAVPAR